LTSLRAALGARLNVNGRHVSLLDCSAPGSSVNGAGFEVQALHETTPTVSSSIDIG
jgi:hypothetical protein